MNKLTTRGGKRAGAGRPKFDIADKTKSRHVKLTDADYSKVKALGGLAKVVRNAINPLQ